MVFIESLIAWLSWDRALSVLIFGVLEVCIVIIWYRWTGRPMPPWISKLLRGYDKDDPDRLSKMVVHGLKEKIR